MYNEPIWINIKMEFTHDTVLFFYKNITLTLIFFS